MGFNAFRMEQLQAEIIRQDELNYKHGFHRNPDPEDPTDYGSGHFDLRKLNEVRESLQIFAQIKDLFYFQHKSLRQISIELKRPIPFIKEMIEKMEAAEGLEIRRKQIGAMFENGLSLKEIAQTLKVSKSQVTLCLIDLKLIDKVTISKKINKRTPKNVVRRQHTETMKQKVLDLCQNTAYTYAEIAKMVGVPRSTVNKWCKQATQKSRKLIKVTPEKKARALELMRLTKMTVAEIAKELDLSWQTIKRWSREENAS